MRKLSLKQLSKEQVTEMSLIEITYELLVEKNEAIVFDELVKEIAAIKGISKKEITAKIVQFYTDLNVDGRFTPLGGKRWGLKTWYPVDQVEEEIVHTTVKAKKKKKSKKAAVIVDEDLDELDDDVDLEDELDIIDVLDDSEDELDDVDLLDEDLDEDDDLDEELLVDEEFELEDEEDEEDDLLDEEDKK